MRDQSWSASVHIEHVEAGGLDDLKNGIAWGGTLCAAG
jgi:hypothetical protein